MKKAMIGVLMMPALTLGLLAFSPLASRVYAEDPVVPTPATTGTGGIDCSGGKDCLTKGSTTGTGNTSAATKLVGENSIVTQTINWMLYIIGTLSVVMLIVGGIRYTMSAGNEKGVKSAKDTILYSIIGIIVAVLAYAIVNFVISAFTV